MSPSRAVSWSKEKYTVKGFSNDGTRTATSYLLRDVEREDEDTACRGQRRLVYRPRRSIRRHFVFNISREKVFPKLEILTIYHTHAQ